MWTFLKWWFVIKLSIAAVVLMVMGAVAFFEQPDQGTPGSDGTSSVDDETTPRASAGGTDLGVSVVGSPLLAVVRPEANTMHTQLETWSEEDSIVLGDGITTYDVHYDVAAESGWYTATLNGSTQRTIVKSGDQLFMQGVDGTQVWYQVAADETVNNLLSKFDFSRVETLDDYVPEPARPFTYLHANGSSTENAVGLDKYKLRFDIAAMRANDAVLQAFDVEWDFDPAAAWVESDVGFDSDGIARWSVSAFHEGKSPISTNYRNLLISFGDDPLVYPPVTDPQPLPTHLDLSGL